MKDLIKQYLDRGISRRTFSAGLVAAGFSGAAARSMAQSLAAPLTSGHLAAFAKCAEPEAQFSFSSSRLRGSNISSLTRRQVIADLRRARR